MNNKIIGIILIIAGVALIAWGYNVYDSVGSQFSRTFSGDTPIEAWIGLVGGAVCVVIGVFRVK
ncbi:DUF3185 family protein [Aliikangiella sp. G2MR2-5]|uniref:DUF3185 family protein n=1 Tax=Aliikangiella sp. G2MR2-5 TaxID=2788943 RepID=UPI0018ABDCA3|nr:DUF3185 family protein [Aliikangiella sp. G2MR2-5]